MSLPSVSNRRRRGPPVDKRVESDARPSRTYYRGRAMGLLSWDALPVYNINRTPYPVDNEPVQDY
jgi:hypothetical protein